ncbi:SprT family zinc-dependent metalloprotease [Marinomonas sp. 2405UD68-3]|uniref:SprT family zinc-dependent metalloprotease n=1 Tax=Marinomonas sp. 2405UD68-3 TaxID=3391835 RepID=UPI0039C94AA3
MKEVFSTSQDLHKVHEKLCECLMSAETYYKRKFVMPVFNFKQRGKAAGTAHLQKNEIRLNYFMYQQDPHSFINDVVPHELAHLIAYTLYGSAIRPHGREWQSVMLYALSCVPSRTHSFDTPTPKQAFQYRCECQNHSLTIRRHNKILKGVVYVCKQCKSPLKVLNY